MQQLKHETTIKRLRAASKETEATVARLQEQMAEAQQTIAQQADELKAAERARGADRPSPAPLRALLRCPTPLCAISSSSSSFPSSSSSAEAAAKAQATVESHLRTIAELEAQVAELKTKDSLHQANLQRAWAELSEQRKAATELVGAAQSDALEKEVRGGVLPPPFACFFSLRASVTLGRVRGLVGRGPQIRKSEELQHRLDSALRESDERDASLRREVWVGWARGGGLARWWLGASWVGGRWLGASWVGGRWLGPSWVGGSCSAG